MSRSWSSIVRGSATLASKLNPDAQVFTPKPRCNECGDVAEVCRRCSKYSIYEKGLCGICFSWNLPSDSMCIGYIHAANDAPNKPLKCAPCSKPKNPSPLREGPVSLQEILAGQRVTAAQFFAAVGTK